jgi:hypothetical protein
MSLIRPQALATLSRWREVLLAAGLALFGLWLVRLGGLVLIPAGLGVLALAAGLGLNAWRRLRFGQAVAAPGLVEVDEGQIAYLGPEIGGFVSLPELVEIKLITLRGRRLWRLKQADGQAILVPVDAEGAERLFDAFASLPGLDTAALLAALEADAATGSTLPVRDGLAGMRLVWRRPEAGGLAHR